MDDIVITVVAWSMAVSMFIGVIGGWLVFVAAWLHDFFTTRTMTLPHRIPRRQHGRHPTNAADNKAI
jgi:hypothetical protein